MRRRIRNVLGAIAVVAGVMAPAAALAEDYPTPPSTPTATTQPSGPRDSGSVGGAETTRTASGSSTLPFTGGEIAALTLAGVGLTGAGVVLLGLGRRHARSRA